MEKIGVKLRQELAEAVGVSPSTLSKAIKEGRVPERWIKLIEEKYNISRDELIPPSIVAKASGGSMIAAGNSTIKSGRGATAESNLTPGEGRVVELLRECGAMELLEEYGSPAVMKKIKKILIALKSATEE